MGKFRAATFYLMTLVEAMGLKDSSHEPGEIELAFSQWAINQSKTVVECGPRTDTYLALQAQNAGVFAHLFEASPTFSKILRKRLRKADLVTVHNLGVGNVRGELRYFLLNQSFKPNHGFPSLGLSKKVSVTDLDSFFSWGGADFIKSDVEGLDIEVLHGATRLLEGASIFQIEMPSQDPTDYNFLVQKGFRLYLLVEKNHPLSQILNEVGVLPLDWKLWPTVSESLARGETNIMVGLKEGMLPPRLE